MTTNGDMLALPSQGALLDSKERASAFGVQILLQSSGEDASISASPVADSNALQVFPTTADYQGSVDPPRLRFHVELKEGETTVVSWKELVKDSQNNALTLACESPANVSPSHVAPPTQKETGADFFLPANRFSSVIANIERGIERLYYKGVDSEEEDEYVSMDEYYDTKDSFIDDTELDEYFQVDTIKPKHTGFFVSKRTLEKVDESLPCPPLQPLPPPPVHLPKKRKQNITKCSREMGEIPKEKVKVSLGLTEATSKTPRPIATVVKTTGSILVKTCEQSVIPKPKKRVKSVRSLTGSILVKTSEQSVIPNPKKRVKPVLSKRDSHAENTTRLSSDCTSRENVQELKGEQAKDVSLHAQDMKPETTNLVNSGVATCLGLDAEQLDGSSDDLQETVGSIDNRRLDGHVLENAVCPAKERRKKQKTVKMGEQNLRKKDDSMVKMGEQNFRKKDDSMVKMGEKKFRKKDDSMVRMVKMGEQIFTEKDNSMVRMRDENLREKDDSMGKMGEQNFRKNDDSITGKHKTDRETASTGRKLPAPESRPTFVALLNKVVPQMEKVIVKVNKQGQDGTRKEKTKGKRNHDAALGKTLSREDARRILVEVGTKHGMEFAKKMRLTLPKALQPETAHNNISGSEIVLLNPILKLDQGITKGEDM